MVQTVPCGQVTSSHKNLYLGQRICSRFCWICRDKSCSGTGTEDKHCRCRANRTPLSHHHSAATGSLQCEPDTNMAADLCPGAACSTDCWRADHLLSASWCRWLHSLARHDHRLSSQIDRGTDCSNRGQYQQTSSGQGPSIITLLGADYVISSGGMVINVGARRWLCACYPRNSSTWDRDAWKRASSCEWQTAHHLCKRRQAQDDLEGERTFQREKEVPAWDML